MRPIYKQRNTIVYTDYGNAKSLLIEQIGQYCSYCERHVNPESALEVEHLLPKSKYTWLENSWRNFLLSCKHCNNIKGTKEVGFKNIHLPHLHNTFLCFSYLESGKIQISPVIKSTVEEPKVQELINLVGLDREPSNKRYNSSDNLVEKRRNAWILAQRYEQKYSSGTADMETIIDIVKTNGFWSIWMKVFEDYIEVREKLISRFAGTATDCFNVLTQPIARRKNRIV